uniref:Reverse transcriptase domain-containing protein n=1 Tax=Macrostomum lignano TaxID=282301 RepID=A0A1I8FK44_9PLAT
LLAHSSEQLEERRLLKAGINRNLKGYGKLTPWSAQARFCRNECIDVLRRSLAQEGCQQDESRMRPDSAEKEPIALMLHGTARIDPALYLQPSQIQMNKNRTKDDAQFIWPPKAGHGPIVPSPATPHRNLAHDEERRIRTRDRCTWRHWMATSKIWAKCSIEEGKADVEARNIARWTAMDCAAPRLHQGGPGAVGRYDSHNPIRRTSRNVTPALFHRLSGGHLGDG